MIPEEAVEAGESVLLGYTGGCTCHEGYSGRNLIDPECTYHDVPPEVVRLILEAALPILLSHEREETRLAHLDAVVNARTVDRLEAELAQAKADLKFLRGERKSLRKHIASWESQGHTTVTLTFLKRYLAEEQR